MPGALPNTVVIGAMKCGSTALSRYLDRHPDVAMAPGKEVNFFFGDTVGDTDDDRWRTGQWHRGVDWYASNFAEGAPVRGEASPGYTSPDHPHVPHRMAQTIPHAQLVYLVRDPAARALSHYAHHARERTESRPVAEAVLDPTSQYLARSRYFERLAPFLEAFGPEQILVVVQERLLANRRPELARVFAHVGADPRWWDERLEDTARVSPAPAAPAELPEAVSAGVADDTARLRALLGDEIPEWPR